MKKLISFLLSLLLLLLSAGAPVVGAEAISDRDPVALSYAASPWTSAMENMSKEQAQAYAAIIENAERTLQNKVNYGNYERRLYVTLFDVGGNTVLWLAGADVSVEWPYSSTSFSYNGYYYDFIYEEIWQWDGFSAVELEMVSQYDANVNLWPDGIEVFTCYRGTDVDGDAWSAFYPFEKGRISTEPKWCHGWAWIYDYKLENLYITSSDKTEIGREFFTEMMSRDEWPTLPFDWDTVEIPMDFSNSFRVEVEGGRGYDDFVSAHGTEYGYDPSYTQNSVQCAPNIVEEDGSWYTAADAIVTLEAVSNTTSQPEPTEEETEAETTAQDLTETVESTEEELPASETASQFGEETSEETFLEQKNDALFSDYDAVSTEALEEKDNDTLLLVLICTFSAIFIVSLICLILYLGKTRKKNQ